ncbi:MAG: glycine cleavage system protein H [Treponemataceae bacterium]|nr:glycine cleavage system protein H [Treponemataceae bacterium]
MNLDTTARYSKEHVWVRKEETLFVVGITQYAQESLGEIIYIEFPHLAHHYEAGSVGGTIESAKAASDIIMPLSGTITAINEMVQNHPEWIRHDCYGKGWLFQLQVDDPEQFSLLLSPDEYRRWISKF